MNAILRLILICLTLQPAATMASGRQIWDFTVYLDDDKVGRHQFVVTEEAQGYQVQSEAKFDVTFLSFTAYRYFHQAQESWRDDCLGDLKAETDDNGSKISITGNLGDPGFLLTDGNTQKALPSCVMTFAYWNPRMLSQRHLLNPQTGEYVDVSITPLGTDNMMVRGTTMQAKRYRLAAAKFDIDLWYAEPQRWVALDSRLENGRLLRYRLE